MKWKKLKYQRKYLCLTLLMAGGFLYSCEKTVLEPVKVTDAAFAKDVQPIFTANCVVCHNGGQSPNLTQGAAYNSLKNGGYINTTTPQDSKLYQKLTTSMASYATDVQKQTILAWIRNGAKNN